MSTYEQHIGDLRQQIAALQADRDQLRALPRDRDDVASIIRGTVAGWQRDGEKHIRTEIARIAAGGAHSLFVARGVVPTISGITSPFDLALGPFLVALVGAKQVQDVLVRHAEEARTGMPAAERETRLAEIAAELDRLERDEEQTIVVAAAEGIAIARRSNARPEVILARAAT
ncbi:MAG: hypothetical protein ROZ64_13650 [Burkholderiaceae bacterium]|jgi:hypothetical protein|nr:hypothetical protein [Burkholderiaceae bacterium]